MWCDAIQKTNISKHKIVVRLSVLLGRGPYSDTTYQPSMHLPCQCVVESVLGFSSVRTLESARYSASGWSIVRVEEGEFVVCWVDP